MHLTMTSLARNLYLKKKVSMSKRIVIIDGNSLINRAYYAMQRPMITSDGTYTQGIYGFINMLTKIINDYEPEYMAVAWDLKAPTFRHKEYKDYKAGRQKMPIELAMQLPIMKEILDAMHIPNLELEGFEADDIIGTIARRSEANGLEPFIITGDKDALQLATDVTKVIITRKGISEFDIYNSDKMEEVYGLTPAQFIDLKGLMGDQSDNIPGIPGVGEKTGIKLLKQFGSVENLVENTEEIDSPKLREKVEDNAQLALMSKRLATIITDVPIDVELDTLKKRDIDKDKLIDIYSRLEFNSFLKKLTGGQSFTKKEEKVNAAVKAETISSYNPKVSELISIGTVEEIQKLDLESEIVINVFSNDSHISMPEIYGISFISGEECYFVSREDIVSAFIEKLNQKEYLLIGHGLIRSLYALMRNGCETLGVSFDTEIAQYIIEPSRSKYTLEVLMLEKFHHEIPDQKTVLEESGQMDLLGNSDSKLAEYGLDVLNSILALKETQESEIKARSLEKVYYDAELPLVSAMAAMEAEGFSVNPDTLNFYGNEMSVEIEKLTKEIHELAGMEFNINSPLQLGDILFEKLGLPAGKKTKTGYSTSADILEKLKDEHPIIEKILRFRTLSKLKSTYVDGLKPLIASDGKIRAHFQQTVTQTGRISCTEPNLQNIPVRDEYGRQLRKAFVPRDENHILIGADYSQIELRVLAHLSGDEGLIQDFKKGADIHRATASRVFGIPYDEVSSLDRSRAKAVNFGVIYGMSGFGLAEELGISRWDAESYINDYFDKHKAVKAYMDMQLESCKENGYTETILGRRRYIPEINAPNKMVRNLGERLAMNSPIQGSAADIIKLAMASVYNRLRDEKLMSKLILQVHDELIIDAPKDEEEYVSKLLIECMESAMELKVDLVCDLKTGGSWYELKD